MAGRSWTRLAGAWLLLIISIEIAHGFRHGRMSTPTTRARRQPPLLAATATGEQERQRMRLLFPPTTRPTSIVFQDRGIWTFEQRACACGCMGRLHGSSLNAMQSIDRPHGTYIASY